MSRLPAHLSFPDGPAERPCPACGGARAERLYALNGIPTQSCVLLPEREAARRFPTGDLCLAICPDCGFVFNERFEPALVDYSEGYEETQGCSGTFSRWLEVLADELVARAPGLGAPSGECAVGAADRAGGGLVLEIGCGRGDFLALLAARAGARGVGVDPSNTAGRVDLAAGRGLDFRREVFSADSAPPFELCVCRHTLEHLPAVGAVAAEFARALAANPAAPLFVEVPDTRRLFTEGAFWDIYYEHCSYFTRGSLARLFERAGLRVGEVRLSYADQYVQGFAAASGAPAETLAGIGSRGEAGDHTLDSPAELLIDARAFRSRCEETLAGWHGRLGAAHAAGETIVLWGSGSKATGFLTTLGLGDRVAAVVDINPAKHGMFVAGTGHEIVAPERLRELRPERVVVMNPIYRDEIAADLRAMGLEPTLDAL